VHLIEHKQPLVAPTWAPRETPSWLKSNSTVRRSRSRKAAWWCMRPKRPAPTSRTSATTRSW